MSRTEIPDCTACKLHANNHLVIAVRVAFLLI